MLKIKLSLTIILNCLCLIGQASDLGVYGQVYPIAEPDILEFIHTKLQSMATNGDLIKMEQKFKEDVSNHTLRPMPVKGLKQNDKPKVHYYDPTFVLSRNIYDNKGQVIALAGKRVNPFDYQALTEVLLFINADNPDEVEWAQRQRKEFALSKIILVKGNLKEAADKEGLGRVYFDQNGLLTRKFGILGTPALVRQTGKQLEIDELPPSKIIRGGAHS